MTACKPAPTSNTPAFAPAEPRTAAVGADPVVEFKKVMEHFPKEGERRVDFVFQNIGFDVKKTDSLIAPVIGIIGFDAAYQSQYNTPALRHTVTLRWQNDVWKLHSFMMDGGHRDADGGDMGKAMKAFLDPYR